MDVSALVDMVRHRHPDRGRAVFELADRAPREDESATALGEVSRLPQARGDRFHLISLAWAAIIGLLAAETAHSRQVAYDAFAALDDSDSANLLDYLKVGRIEDAHPTI